MRIALSLRVGADQISDGTVVVTAVEPAGEAEVHSMSVPMIGGFAFSAGVLGKSS